MDLIASLLPDGIPVWVAALLVAASFFTSALTATFGIGGGIAMLALMGIFVPVAALIPVHGAVQLGSNSGRAWHQRAHIRWPIFAPFVAGSIVGAVVGAFVVVQLPDALMKLVLGAFIIAITWTTIPGMAEIGRAGLAAASAVLALLSMMLGATGPLLSALLGQMITGDRKALVATMAGGMTIQHVLKVIVFSIAGFAFHEWFALVAAMIVTGYLGTVYGSMLLEKFDETVFRTWFRIGITVLALDLVRRGVTGLI